MVGDRARDDGNGFCEMPVSCRGKLAMAWHPSPHPLFQALRTGDLYPILEYGIEKNFAAAGLSIPSASVADESPVRHAQRNTEAALPASVARAPHRPTASRRERGGRGRGVRHRRRREEDAPVQGRRGLRRGGPPPPAATAHAGRVECGPPHLPLPCRVRPPAAAPPHRGCLAAARPPRHAVTAAMLRAAPHPAPPPRRP